MMENPSGAASPRVALTQEEMRLLLQCNRDAFWQRSLPMMVALGASTHMLVKMGYLRPHATRGSLFKVLASACAGWIIGKMSFRSECQRRILEQLPNSRLAEMVRNKQSAPQFYQQQPGGPLVVPPPRSDVDFGPPKLDESQQSQTASSTGSSAVTYDELRRRHHSEALAQEQEKLARQQDQLRQPLQKPQQQQPVIAPSKLPSGIKVNKYGDVVEEGEE